MNVKIVLFFDVDSRRVQDRSQDMFLAPQRGARRPLGEWITSNEDLFGGSWSGKSLPGLNFVGKTMRILTISFFALNDFL